MAVNISAENVGGVLKFFDKGYEDCLHFSSFTLLYCFLAFIKQCATSQDTHRVNLCFIFFLSVKAFAVVSDVNKRSSKISPVSSVVEALV